jgi:hypothetical protein
MKKTAIDACGHKCPCRLWINCPYYIDKKKQELRLKKKEYDYIKWYKDNFKITFEMPDSSQNG